MRLFDRGAADTYQVAGVEVARWEQYSLDGLMPFQAMWYSVPPGGVSPRDQHPEVELSLVVSGLAGVEVAGAVAEVAAGSSFLLAGNESHIVHNRSMTEPLLVFSAYWMPEGTDV